MWRLRVITLVAGLTLMAGTAETASAVTSGVRTAPRQASTTSSTAPGIPGGTQLWLDRFTGGKHRNAYDATVAASPDSSLVYVTGYTAALARRIPRNLTTIAYNTSTGAEVWMAAYQGVNNHPGSMTPSIVVSPNGNEVFIAAGSFYQSEILAYNAHTGAMIWESSTIADRRRPKLLAVSPDSSRLVQGMSSHYSFAFTTFAARSGRNVGPSETYVFKYENSLYGVAVSSDGSEVILTSQNATVGYDAATGAKLWRVWDGGSMAVSPDSATVIIAKPKLDPATGLYYYLTTAYDTVSGAVLWTARYRAANGVVHGLPGIAISPDGSSVFLTGAVYASSQCCDTSIVTIAYNAVTGAQTWTAGYTGPGDSNAQGIIARVSPDGSKVYILADTETGNTVIAYGTASGTQLWNTPASYQTLSSMAVSANGHTVVVAGTLETSGRTSYLTIGYKA
jgi:outer membrane protein assembly factor BamB